MTYPEAIQFLYDLRLFGAKLGLENTRRLAALAGNPQEKLRFIHVAGTNGKGSTCAMLESMYRKAGLRVGLYTSPHLISFCERIQVNRKPISKEAVVRLVEKMKEYLADFPGEAHPTFFEVVTVMALMYFAEEKCDLVIWETGMGGRLDATNIVRPLASVITNVSLDHEKWLGATIEEIAFEKAGIIKPAVPVFTAADDPKAVAVICEQARKQNAPLTVVTAADIPTSIDLPLAGQFQKPNAALARATARGLSKTLPISTDQMVAGLVSVHWPGRMQKIVTPQGRTIILDGAHNPAGAEALRKELHNHTNDLTLIFGVLDDKDSVAILQALALVARSILLVPVQSQRTARPESLAAPAKTANARAEISVCSSLSEALQRASGDPLVVVTGSLYLVGEAMELLGIAEFSQQNERALNEWGAVPAV